MIFPVHVIAPVSLSVVIGGQFEYNTSHIIFCLYQVKHFNGNNILIYHQGQS